MYVVCSGPSVYGILMIEIGNIKEVRSIFFLISFFFLFFIFYVYVQPLWVMTDLSVLYIHRYPSLTAAVVPFISPF